MTILNGLSPLTDIATYVRAAEDIVQVESALASVSTIEILKISNCQIFQMVFSPQIYDNRDILTAFRRVTLGELPELSN